jgi:outer membrane protein OmpA-like peptidoglycan-associated protein/tetratricopeptide (TPR) repeat protein
MKKVIYNLIKAAIASIFIMLIVTGCGYQSRVNKANYYYENTEYIRAIPMYAKLYEKDTANQEVITKLAESYYKVNDFTKALPLYIKSVTFPEVADTVKFNAAQVMRTMGMEEEAKALSSTVIKAKSIDLYKDTALFRITRLSLNTLQPDFGPVLYDGGMVFASSRRSFGIADRTNDWTGKLYLGLFQAKGKGLEFSKVTPLESAFQTAMNDGPVCFNKQGNQVFITRNNLDPKAKWLKDDLIRLKIYTMKKVNGKWIEAAPLPFNSDNYRVAHPALNEDGSKLYFASDMPGGFGGMDLYVSTYENETWSTPVNLGAAVNTRGTDAFPTIEGNILYYSSNGFEGIGGLDIYKMELTGTPKPVNMGAPFNSSHDDFGYIRDSKSETVYLSSNRLNKEQDDDIYGIVRTKAIKIRVVDAETNAPIDSAGVELQTGTAITTNEEGETTDVLPEEIKIAGITAKGYEPDPDPLKNSGEIVDGYLTVQLRKAKPKEAAVPVITEAIPVKKQEPPAKQEINIKIQIPENSELKITLEGTLSDAASKKPITNKDINISNLTTEKSVTVVTDKKGIFTLELQRECDYVISTVAPENCVADVVKKSTRGSTGSEVVKAELKQYCVGDIIEIENIYYDLNKSNIRKDAALILDKTVALLKQYPNMKIELGSHTDCRASDAYNNKLSQGRADAAVEYLISHGIDPSRLVAKGYGETKLLNKCKDGVSCSEKEHQQNRRTEFRILSID